MVLFTEVWGAVSSLLPVLSSSCLSVSIRGAKEREPRINTNQHEIVKKRQRNSSGKVLCASWRRHGAACQNFAKNILIMQATLGACASYGAAVLHIVERSGTMLHAQLCCALHGDGMEPLCFPETQTASLSLWTKMPLRFSALSCRMIIRRRR